MVGILGGAMPGGRCLKGQPSGRPYSREANVRSVENLEVRAKDWFWPSAARCSRSCFRTRPVVHRPGHWPYYARLRKPRSLRIQYLRFEPMHTSYEYRRSRMRHDPSNRIM